MQSFVKSLLVGLVFSSVSVLAIDPYTLLLTQYDSTGLNQIPTPLSSPYDHAYLYYNPSTNKPEWRLVSSGSVTSTQITDSSSVGRGVLTASTQALARSAIGAGTSNFSGDYTDLSDRPTNLTQFTNNAGFITALTAPVVSVNGSTGAVSLNAASVGAAASSHTHSASQVSDSSTIGRQLLTAINQAAVQSIVGMPSAQVNSDWSASSGVAQILNKPVKYTGSTNGSGVYAVTYGSAYSTKPHLVFSIEGGTNKDTSVLTSTSTTGFSVIVERRSDVLGLLPTYAVVSGITVNATVTP